MKKSLLSALALTPIVASGQGLFDIAPNDEALESVNVNYTAGVRVGYDSNLTPSTSEDNGSLRASTYIGFNAAKVADRATLEVYGRYTISYNFDTPAGVDDVEHEINLGLNYTYRFNERVRFSSRNTIGYGLEPDFNFGFANTREFNEYLYWSSDNSIGYKFSDKVGAFFGVGFDGTIFDGGNPNSDRKTVTPYTQWRYQLNPRTVLTAGYRYRFHFNETDRDAQSHIITAGFEHRVNPSAIFVVRAGVQIFDVDDGDTTTAPYIETAYRWSASSRTKFRAFARWGITSFNTSFLTDSFDINQNVRVGLAGTHQVSERLTVNGGIDYIFNDFQDSANGTLEDVTGNLANIYVGLNYRINQNLYFDATVNQTVSTSDLDARDFDRTRVSAGLSYSW